MLNAIKLFLSVRKRLKRYHFLIISISFLFLQNASCGLWKRVADLFVEMKNMNEQTELTKVLCSGSVIPYNSNPIEFSNAQGI